MKDYYKILGVNKNSSEDDIKMAYKKLAMKYHPDRNPNDSKSEEKFKDIKEAYENLTNKNRGAGAANGFGPNINFADFASTESSLDDIFNVIFKRNFKKDNKNYYSLDVDLECSVYGSSIDVKIPNKGDCSKCFGKGHNPSSELKICLKCGGVGVYTIMQGIFNFKQKCFKCNGKGYIFKENCVFCFGSGKIDKNISCLVTLKKNIDNNSFVSIDFGESNLKNQIFIFIKIKPHPIFSRKNSVSNDLLFNYYLDFVKAVIGGYIKVFTFYGFILYKINCGSQSNTSYKLDGFGLHFTNKPGDLYLNIIIEVITSFDINQWFLINKLSLYIFDSDYLLIHNIDKNLSLFYNLVFNV
ncbi:MAG: DnaJ domain-containing protein [Candidatus Nasuia deltocephalinicola]